MALLGKPSRSYAGIDHDANGMPSVSSYGAKRQTDGFKTYRPPLSESHLRRTLLNDPNPNSAFAPLPPAFDLSRKHRKDQALAGQKAELDHILQPGYKSTSSTGGGEDGDSVSMAGPSRSNGFGQRTAGGLGLDRKGKMAAGLGIRPSASMGNFKTAVRISGMGGVYVDSSGKVHDTEFDPFAGVAEMSRLKTRRKSAFGQEKRRASGGSTSSEGSVNGDIRSLRQSMDGHTLEEAENKKKVEMERRRMDEVEGYTAARRRSFVSQRNGNGEGRSTPSVRSSDEGHAMERGGNGYTSRSRSSQGYHVRSPLSPTFGGPTSSSSYATSRTLPTTVEILDTPDMDAEKTTDVISPPYDKHVQRTVIGPNKKVTITGFDAPSSPMGAKTPSGGVESLKPPDSGRPSIGSRASSDLVRDSSASRRPKPASRPREELFPETPAQVKRREDRQRRERSGLPVSRVPSADTPRTRVLPEIEIVEDDDPRIIFPEHGRTTRIQTTHDHVIRGPFSHALNVQQQPRRGSADAPNPYNTAPVSQPPPAARSVSGAFSVNTLLDEGTGGYLPSRWRSGDRALRVTEDEKEKYRPREWGGRKGDLAGKNEEWKPSTKETIKRNWKDLAVNARFSMFRAKKKLLRTTDI